ncbi:MAG: PHP domain-containing protein [Clostridia bacterium]|nr:PHP domain-containing protein [Clostridia bacterium]
MKKYILPQEGQFYKANLHCHSTVSDGRWTPEEIKKNYMAHGYSIVAYTDHQVLVPHNELAEEGFLPLNGYEIDIPEDRPWDEVAKTCHTCFIALDPERTVQKIYHDSVFIDQNRDRVQLAADREPVIRRYDPAFINAVMAEGRQDGFFVIYCHPVWSLESDGEFMNYHGMHAMEMVNYGSYVTGHEEHNGILYDRKLHSGEMIYCVASDDNHDVFPMGHPKCDSFGGFTMIKAERLEYGAVAEALLNGHFYASEGPEIHELYLEDGKVHIKTSDAVRIVMTTGFRYNKARTAEQIGETINEAVFTLNQKDTDYVRIIVRDREGKEAYTNAYRVADLKK